MAKIIDPEKWLRETEKMTLEERKDNTYYDQSGRQILVGDLLKVFHYRISKKTTYMFQVVVMEETIDFPVMAVKAHYADKPHCRMYVLAKNRIYKEAEIIGTKDWETKRNNLK